MGVIKINNIIYGSNNSADIIYKNTTVEEKLDTIPVFDINDNGNVSPLSDVLTYGHIVDSLNSTATEKVLSANQGNSLNEKVVLLNSKITEINNSLLDLENIITNKYNELNNLFISNKDSLNEKIDSNYTELNNSIKTKVSKSGDTMTGMLTSNTGNVLIGSRQSSAETVPALVNELRYQNGGMGSVNFTSAYSPIPAGWFCYLYIPHRTGGASGDNYNYGCLILVGMTAAHGRMWTVSVSGGSIHTITEH